MGAFLILWLFASLGMVLAVYISTQEGMIFGGLRVWAETKSERVQHWLKPVLLCIWCMASLYSIIGYLLTSIVLGFGFYRLILFAPVVIGFVSFAGAFLWKLVDLVTVLIEEKERKLNENIKPA